jgi:hypothetical protein
MAASSPNIGGQLTVPVQDFRKVAGMRSDMENHGDGGGALPWQSFSDAAHIIQRACRYLSSVALAGFAHSLRLGSAISSQ